MQFKMYSGSLKLCLFVGLLLAVSTTLAQKKIKESSAQPSFHAVQAAHPSKSSKVSGHLRELQQAYRNAKPTTSPNGRMIESGAKELPKRFTKLLLIQGGYVTVDVVAQGSTDELVAQLSALGARNMVTFGRVTSCRLPIDKIGAMETLSSIRFASAAYKPLTNIGAVTSQGDSAQRSGLARRLYNVDGLGVKIGALSDSYDYLNGASAGIATGDLPGPGNPNGWTTPVEVLADLDTTGVDEGRAMLEIVHDVAPGAELAFHTAYGGEAAFAQGIINLANAGCDVIVDDIIYVEEAYFSDGIIAQAVDSVTKMGVSFFSSAGNNSILSYESAYRPSDVEVVGTGNGTAHNFSAPGDAPRYLQPIFIPRNGFYLNVLQWDDPFFSATGVGAKTDLDFYLLDSTGTVVAVSANRNLDVDPTELLFYENPDIAASETFYLVIVKAAGPDPNRLKQLLFGQGEFIQTDPVIPGIGAPTVVGHANAKGAIATGAAFYRITPPFGVNPPQLESFSSVGGTPIFFDVQGNRLFDPVVRSKPEITAPDGGSNTFFPPAQIQPPSESDIEGDGFPNFFGTSASAPHAAAVATLMIEAHCNPLSPTQVKEALMSTAVDMDNPYTAGVFDTGFDFASGAGLIQADKAVEQVAFTPTLVANLNLTSVCSEDPNEQRRWRVRNSNPFSVRVTWEVYETDQKGQLMAPPGDSFFYTEAISGPNTTIIAWKDETGAEKRNVKASSGAQCGAGRLANEEGKDDAEAFSLVTAFPNPTTNGKLNVLFLGNDRSPVNVKLYDLKGRVVEEKVVKVEDNNPELGIDVSQFPAGLYLMQVRQGLSKQQTIKVVVSHR